MIIPGFKILKYIFKKNIFQEKPDNFKKLIYKPEVGHIKR